MKENKVIYGKVLKIINEYNIVVSISNKDVKKGDTLTLFKEIEISSDNGDNLPPLEYELAEIIVVEAFDNYSLCYSNEVENTNLFANLISSERIVPLKIDSSNSENFYKGNERIQIGTSVKFIKKIKQTDGK